MRSLRWLAHALAIGCRECEHCVNGAVLRRIDVTAIVPWSELRPCPLCRGSGCGTHPRGAP